MNKNKKKQIWNAVYTVLLMLLIGFLLVYPKIAMSLQTRVDYPVFLQQVSQKKIEEVTIHQRAEKISYTLPDGTKCYTNYPDYENFKVELLKNGVKIKINEPNPIEEALPYISLLVMLLIMLVFLKSLNFGSGGYTLETRKQLSLRFSDVAGMEEIKQDLLQLAEMMQNPVYREQGAHLPKGILLEGPPGNGKTFISRAFAGETGVNFIAVNASDFSSSLVGVGSSKVRKLFKKAKANKPCVIFIDEIDGVGSSRSSDNSAAGREMNTIITALLNELDGFGNADGILVMAATNRADSLDEALIRPGRFDRRLVVSYPDKTTRQALLELYTRKMPLASSVETDKLANRTFGCSCSEIECIVNEAKIMALRHHHSAITKDDFEQAFLQMTIKGNLRAVSQQNDEERRQTAYHEAGHAVLSACLTDEVVSMVTIRPTTSGAGGFTMLENEEDKEYISLGKMRGKMAMLYGGRAAEYLLAGKDIAQISSGCASDVHKVTELAGVCAEMEQGMDFEVFTYFGEKAKMEAVQGVLAQAWETAVSVLEEKWDCVEKIAALLLEKETISKEVFLPVMQSEAKENLNEK